MPHIINIYPSSFKCFKEFDLHKHLCVNTAIQMDLPKTDVIFHNFILTKFK